jgi:hypothetical protein
VNAQQRAAAGGMLVAAAMALAGAVLGSPSLQASAVQAGMAEWGAMRLGVTWNDPEGPHAELDWREAWRKSWREAPPTRAVRGALFGLAAAGAAYGLATSTGAVLAILPTTGGLILLSTSGDALLGSVRDEMLLHGLVLRVIAPPRDRLAPRLAAVAACGLASAAWALGDSGNAGLPLARVAFEALAGGAFGALWLVDHGAWLPVSAHVAWRFATRATVVLAAATPWGGGADGLWAGGSAVTAAAVVCAVAVVAAVRTTLAPAARAS